jgi:hypothetical protein
MRLFWVSRDARHDTRRYAIPQCLGPSHPDTKARCTGDGIYLIYPIVQHGLPIYVLPCGPRGRVSLVLARTPRLGIGLGLGTGLRLGLGYRALGLLRRLGLGGLLRRRRLLGVARLVRVRVRVRTRMAEGNASPARVFVVGATTPHSTACPPSLAQPARRPWQVPCQT